MNTLRWFETEYLQADLTVQAVLVNDDVLLYTMYDTKGYNYLFTSVRDLFDYVYGGDRTYFQTFERERDMIKFLMEM